MREHWNLTFFSHTINISNNQALLLDIIAGRRNKNFRVRLRANAVDPEVILETGETIAVSGYPGQ